MTQIRRPLRIALIALAAIIVVLVGAGAIFLAQFDPNSLKPRIEEAVKRATGRDLALNGPIGLKLSLTPTVEVRDAAFSNPPGFSRPQMATLQSVELRLALLPLLSRQIQIASLALIRPDILLETNAAGQPNWKLTPQVSPNEPPGAQAPASGPAQSKTTVSIESVSIQNGNLAYRDEDRADHHARAANPDRHGFFPERAAAYRHGCDLQRQFVPPRGRYRQPDAPAGHGRDNTLASQAGADRRRCALGCRWHVDAPG